MDFLICGIINGPFATLSIMANLFYVFCMVYPLHREGIRQPLKLLLGSMIYSAVAYLISVTVMFLDVAAENLYVLLASHVVFAWSLSTGAASVVWLNFFYFTKIVPAQTALFIWIKKNIKHVIYCIWLSEIIFRIFDVAFMVIDHLTLTNLLNLGFSNFTVHSDRLHIHIPYPDFVAYLYKNAFCIVQFHFFLSVCVMMLSSGSTVIFLGTHMRRMQANGQCLSCPRFRNQVRVTVTSILQGVLFFFCSMWVICKSFVEQTSKELINPYYNVTVLNLYIAVSTLTLGIGQSVFRRRFEDLWLRVTHCCRAHLA